MSKYAESGFLGHRPDLDAFLKLARSPQRSEARGEALAAWDEDRLRRLIADVRRRGGKFAKGWLLAHMARRVLDLRGARLDGICVGTVDLRGVRLDGASLRGVWLKGARFARASLRSADFGSLEEEGIPGSFGWGAARLPFTDFSQADLTGANLRGAWLEDASFRGAVLEGADLRGASLDGATFRDAVLDGAALRNADLSHASFVGTSLRGTRLSGARVYGVSAWDLTVCEDEALRQGLVVSRASEPDVIVDDLEVAQFVYMLLSREKLRTVIQAVTSRGVLILGRFRDGGIEVLQGMAEVLRHEGYLPMIFDFDRPDERDYSDTVRILASMSRFIVADLSGGSVPHELASNVPFVEVPLVAVLAEGDREYSMFRDLFRYPWVCPDVVRFRDLAHLRGQIPGLVVAPAEERVAMRSRRLEEYD